MRNLIIKGSKLNGEIKAPPSKAYTHRAVIAASMAEGSSKIENPLLCQDTEATRRAATQYGSNITHRENLWIIESKGAVETPQTVIDCNESAATLRFIAPILAKARGISILTGRKGLLKRPMNPMIEALRQLGVKSYSTKGDGCPPIVVFGGGIKGGKAVVRGDVSSQFVSGLIFAAPLAENDVTVTLSTKLESKPYVHMTLDVLRKHGIQVTVEEYGKFSVPAGQRYLPQNHDVEGDYSSAAFLMAAAVTTKSFIRIKNLNPRSIQGDKKILETLAKMSIGIKVRDNEVEIEGSDGLEAAEIDARDTPDLVPVIVALGCFGKGETIIRNVRRLQFKESDRISSMITEFSKTGARLRYDEGNLMIRGGTFKPARFHSHNDHRIAMACSVIALGIKGKSSITSYGCIKKSYPNFYQDLVSLGAEIIGA